MNIRILVFLVVSVVLIAACKKDKNPANHTVRGTVLHIADRSPIADVEVRTSPFFYPGANIATNTTHTNAQGEFALEVPHNLQRYYPYPLVYEKNNMVVCPIPIWRSSFQADTVYMDQSSFLRIINKMKSPGIDTQFINGYFVYTDNPPAHWVGYWPAGDTLLSDIGSGAAYTDTLLIPYSHRMFKAGGAALSEAGPSTLVYKPANLVAFDTTETVLE